MVMDLLQTFDTAGLDSIVGLRQPLLDHVMLAISEGGRRGLVWIVIATVVALARPDRLGGVWQLVLGLLISFTLVDAVLKPAIARDRPFVAAPGIQLSSAPPSSFSFPSGHASMAFAGAFVVGRLWRRGRPLLWVLAFLIALSRVYLGVHFPLDVIAGALLGVGIGWVVTGGAWWDEPAAPSVPDDRGRPIGVEL